MTFLVTFWPLILIVSIVAGGLWWARRRIKRELGDAPLPVVFFDLDDLGYRSRRKP